MRATFNCAKLEGIKGGSTKIEVIDATSLGVGGWAGAFVRDDDFINDSPTQKAGRQITIGVVDSES